jgi:hypothetical protein
MAQPKKGQLVQFLVPMVDGTDFASVESGITESDFNSGATKRFFGVNHNGSAATTSGAVSKLASLVHSGVFRITLKGTENNYDRMQLRINKTGCAEQIIEWETVDNDDSDIMSAILLAQSAASDAASAAAQANSRVLVNQSYLSDIRSHVSDLQSDFQSRVPKAVATNSQLSDLHSDLRSQIGAAGPTVSDIASAVWAESPALLLTSRVSDIQSAIAAGVPISASDMSDLRSAITAGATGLDASALSDIASAVVAAIGATGVELGASTMSDLRSALAAVGITASDMSDIASRVDATLASRLSDILSAAQQANSRVLVAQSQASDIYSAVLAGVEVGASSISDITSAVWARAGADPTTVPAVTAGMGAKLDWLTALSRNKLVQNSAVQALRNDADSADIASAALSDDATTAPRGEWG